MAESSFSSQSNGHRPALNARCTELSKDGQASGSGHTGSYGPTSAVPELAVFGFWSTHVSGAEKKDEAAKLL